MDFCVSLNWNYFGCSNVRADQWKINSTHSILVFIGAIPRRGSHWGHLGVPSVFSPAKTNYQSYFPLDYEEGSSMQEKQPLYRQEWEKGTSIQADGTKGDIAVLQEPPSHLCNNCSRELGTLGMLFLGSLPGSQLAALLLLGVNERSSGFRCYPDSQTPQSGGKGGALARGTQIYSVQFSPLRTALVEQVAALQWQEYL